MAQALTARPIRLFVLASILSGGLFLLIWPSILRRDVDLALGRKGPLVSGWDIAMLIGGTTNLLLLVSGYFFGNGLPLRIPVGLMPFAFLLVSLPFLLPVGYVRNLSHVFSSLSVLESKDRRLSDLIVFVLLCFTPLVAVYLQRRLNNVLSKSVSANSAQNTVA